MKNKSTNSSRFERHLRLAGEGLWIFLGQVAVVVGALVGIRVLTGLMDPIVYGQLALGMTIAAFVQSVIFGPLSNGITRFYAAACEDNTVIYYFTAVRKLMVFLTVGVILSAFVLCIGMMFTGLSQWIGMGIAVISFAIFSGYNSIFNGIQNASRQRAVVALHQGLASWMRFLLASVLILWVGVTSTVAMTGYVLAMLIVLVSQYGFLRRIMHLEHGSGTITNTKTKEWLNRIFAYSWPFASWGVLDWLNSASDRWALNAFASTREVGLYVAIFQLGYYPFIILAGMGIQLLSPIFFQHASDASDPNGVFKIYVLGWKITLFAIFFTLMTTVLSALFHKAIFSLLVAKEYAVVSSLLPGMVLAGGLFISAQFCTIALHAQQTTKFLIIPNNVSCLMGLSLTIIGAAWYGVTGVVVASVMYSVIRLLWIVFIFRKQCKNIAWRTSLG